VKKPSFTSFRTVLVPVVHGCEGLAALAAARALNAQIILVGLVPTPAGASLSASAAQAREVRQRLRALADGERIRSRAHVLVSYTPWRDLLELIADDEPDLLILDWAEHFTALGITPAEALTRPPCNVALARGPFPAAPLQILVPVRGGPHAELALRAGLSLQGQYLTTLHLSPPEGASSQPGLTKADAPFRGLKRVLAQLPDVQHRALATADPAQTILEQAAGHNLIIMGTTAQPARSATSLGPVADRILREAPTAVLAVKNRRPMPHTQPDEMAGTQAISILVDKWFAENTFHADEFSDLQQLVALKQQGVMISLALPALNEEETVGKVIRTIQRALMPPWAPLIDEIVLMDSNSSDRTRDIARELGLPVYIHQELLPDLGARRGKGEALWKSVLVTRGDILAWIDTDIVNIHPRFVYGILGPLLLNPRIMFVKGFYRRPLKVGQKMQAGGGGRVTELTARPMLNMFYPELSGVVQPLAGEYAARRTFLEQAPFFSGYGVETGLLIEAFERHGLAAIAQVDLLERIHHNQTLEALSKMSFVILQAFFRKLEKRFGRPFVEDVNKSMKLVRHNAGGYFLDVEEVLEHERPPMVDVPEYQTRRAGDSASPATAPLGTGGGNDDAIVAHPARSD
jgi:glycosyltransferase involved in cell wall biosynthesis/nucleotide-binding universal stress UspA family protein